MYSQFHDEREGLPDLPEVRFFTESILEKQNRSKMRFHKDSTPFLADRSDDVVGIYNPPVPSVRGLPEGKRYEYSKFPAVNTENFGPISTPKVLVEGPEMRRKVRTDTTLSRFVTNNAQRLGKTDSTHMYRPTSKKEAINPKAKGAAEYRFDDILYQGRRRFVKTTKALAKFQAIVRQRKCRKIFLKVLKSIRLIQRVFRGHKGCQVAHKRRLLSQAVSNQQNIIILQSAVRMFVRKSVFRRLHSRAIKIQSFYRMGRVRLEYRVVLRSFRQLKAVLRGWILRILQRRDRQALMEMYKTHLLLLWKVYQVSNFHRGLFLTMVQEPSFLNVALLKAELLRMYSVLGITDIVLARQNKSENENRTKRQSRVLEEAPQSDSGPCREQEGAPMAKMLSRKP